MSNYNHHSKIGKNPKSIRQDTDIFRNCLPKLEDLLRNTVVTVESRANPTLENLTKIAKTLNIGINDLIN
ncbi:MAG: hypothetical protein A3G85_09360 [Elusimicrobia bacterium RIFCSPLOWO2_12_FULL_39_28]|nr:MAG: hypothetical protein A3G85_09360 [Elusimicrobia bacterium RIFCSPLOWO2_12_FULL_39_28]